jgi:proteasome lid subunit RPN8/RPN11
MLNLSKKTFNLIKNHALTDNPNECCGLLVESGNYVHPYPCKNMADDKINNFSVSPYDYINASENSKIVGFYHSHCLKEQPNEFTLLDKLNSINHKLPLVLYYLPNDEFKIFNDKDVYSQYIGRRFSYNESDCLSLVQDFYSNEFDIKLPNKFRDEHWIRVNPREIIDNIPNFGFKELHVQENLKHGDIIISKNSTSAPAHLMIYLENNQVLHQKLNSYSTVEQYSNLYKENTYIRIRHKELC